jgi:hypothetical protein
MSKLVNQLLAAIEETYSKYEHALSHWDGEGSVPALDKGKLESLLFSLEGRGGSRDRYDWMLAL